MIILVLPKVCYNNNISIRNGDVIFMQLGPKFITVDEFDNYWTANLREMLRTSANESNQAEMFLARVERRLMA